MENGTSGIECDRAVGNDAGVVPALFGGVVHQKHMVGEILTEAEFIIIGFFFFVLCEFVTDVKHNASFLEKVREGETLRASFDPYSFGTNYIIIRFCNKNKTFC